MIGLFDGMAEARRRIAEEAARRTGRLDLRNLGLAALPEELFALTHLRELDRNRLAFFRRHCGVASLEPEMFSVTMNTAEVPSTSIARMIQLLVN